MAETNSHSRTICWYGAFVLLLVTAALYQAKLAAGQATSEQSADRHEASLIIRICWYSSIRCLAYTRSSRSSTGDVTTKLTTQLHQLPCQMWSSVFWRIHSSYYSTQTPTQLVGFHLHCSFSSSHRNCVAVHPHSSAANCPSNSSTDVPSSPSNSQWTVCSCICGWSAVWWQHDKPTRQLCKLQQLH